MGIVGRSPFVYQQPRRRIVRACVGAEAQVRMRDGCEMELVRGPLRGWPAEPAEGVGSESARRLIGPPLSAMVTQIGRIAARQYDGCPWISANFHRWQRIRAGGRRFGAQFA